MAQPVQFYPFSKQPLTRARVLVGAAYYAGYDLEQGEAAEVVASAAECLAEAVAMGLARPQLLHDTVAAAAALMSVPHEAREPILKTLHLAICEIEESQDVAA